MFKLLTIILISFHVIIFFTGLCIFIAKEILNNFVAHAVLYLLEMSTLRSLYFKVVWSQFDDILSTELG